jgi:hypothetical protein
MSLGSVDDKARALMQALVWDNLLPWVCPA